MDQANISRPPRSNAKQSVQKERSSAMQTAGQRQGRSVQGLKSLHGGAKKRSEAFPTLFIEGPGSIYRGFRDEGLVEGLVFNNNTAKGFIEGPRTH